MNTDKKTENAASEARRKVWIMMFQGLLPILAERDYKPLVIELFDRCEQVCLQADDPDRDPMLDELRLIRERFLQGSVEVRVKVEGDLSVNQT